MKGVVGRGGGSQTRQQPSKCLQERREGLEAFIKSKRRRRRRRRRLSGNGEMRRRYMMAWWWRRS